MRQLRACDFCGDDAAGVFEVIPPELTPADDQRRVALCADCRETLEFVVEPLLVRLGVHADVDVPEDAAAATGASATTPSPTDETAGDAATVDVDAVEPAPTSPHPANHESPDDPDDSADATAATDESETEARPRNADPDGDDGDGADPDDTDRVGGRSEPPNFRTVVRILQNREFPVERAEVESLAASAYDLEDDEVREIFDYAVERGLLEDDGGTLRKP